MSEFESNDGLQLELAHSPLRPCSSPWLRACACTFARVFMFRHNLRLVRFWTGDTTDVQDAMRARGKESPRDRWPRDDDKREHEVELNGNKMLLSDT